MFLLIHFLQYEFMFLQNPNDQSPGFVWSCLAICRRWSSKPIDFLTKIYLANISKRSKKFCKLANTNNICVVYNNKQNLKKLLVRTKIIWINNLFCGRPRQWLGSYTRQQQWFCKKSFWHQTCVCRHESLYKKQTRADLLAKYMQGKHTFWVIGIQLWPNFPSTLKKLLKPIT